MPGLQSQAVTIDTVSIPKYVRPFLLASIADAAAEYMKQPGVAEKYEAWLAAKKAAEAAKQGGEFSE